MPCKVIPFPAVDARRAEEPIIARHHIELHWGESRYDLDVIGFVKALASLPVQPQTGGTMAAPVNTTGPVPGGPATVVQVVGWSRSLRHGRVVMLRLEGGKQRWEEYWRQLGIAIPAPGEAGAGKISLALRRQQRDESSCAKSAQKEENMTNAQNPDPAPAGTAGAAAKPARSRRGTTPKKGAAKGRKRATSQPPTGRSGTTRSAIGTKTAKTAAAVQSKKPRAQSKGAQILELIGRAKGATLAEITQATSWQAHSVRGFLSTAAKKHQLKIVSGRNDAGERVYKVER